MEELLYFYNVIGIILTLFLVAFLWTTISEHRENATLKVLIFGLLFILYWFVFDIIYIDYFYMKIINISILTIFSLLFFLPIGKNNGIIINIDFAKSKRVDERDTMFARSYLMQDSNEYNVYYQMHPENKKIDDKIRALPKLLSSGSKYYNEYHSNYVRSLFDIEESRVDEVDGTVNPHKKIIDDIEASKLIKEITLHLGADEVGIALLNPNYIYSNSAIGPEKWGSSINNNHKYVIAYTLEMNYHNVEQAPRVGITEESANKYLIAQHISIALAKYIRSLGYSARAHISGSNYQIMLPPVAYDAGLGELSRMNYLISKKFGPRIRLGAVSTDLPMSLDKPIKFGVQDFCEKCLKCAYNCPSGAISKNSKQEIRGVEKWQLQIEKCYQYWRIIGTDCGLCMKVCPFSHPNTLIHNMIRYGIKNSVFARTISAWGDDLIYGKKFKY